MTMPELTPRILYNQFVLSRERRPDLADWVERDSAGWVLQTHPTLPVIALQAVDSAAAGWLLGFPLASDGLLPRDSVLRLPAGAGESMAGWQAYLDGLAGRWLAIVFAQGEGRVYLDPSGSLAAVYGVDEPVLCSTPSVLGKGPQAKDWDEALVRVLPDKWYPFGLTPHRSLRRLLPNHYLDLQAWQPVRHWPEAERMGMVQDTYVAVSRIVALVAGIVKAAVDAGSYLTLTAGFDTRVLLACARPLAAEAAFFTSNGSRTDVQGATELARRFGLHHVVVPEHHASVEEQRTRMYLTGYTYDIGSYQRMGSHRRHLQWRRLQVTGHGGHVGRDSDFVQRGTRVAEPGEILRDLRIPPLPQFTAAARAWLNATPALSDHQRLDLAYIEQRLGCCTGPQQYDFDFTTLPALHGFSHREVYELMIRLPGVYRQTGFFADMCHLAWPETLEVPINAPWGVTRYQVMGERVLRRLHLR